MGIDWCCSGAYPNKQRQWGKTPRDTSSGAWKQGADAIKLSKTQDSPAVLMAMWIRKLLVPQMRIGQCNGADISRTCLVLADGKERLGSWLEEHGT